jgi:hypothetical protein
MFEGVTLLAGLQVVGWVLVGLTLRTFVPYAVTAWRLIKKTNKWRLPPFEPKYILPPTATLGVYVLGVLMVQGALLRLTQAHPTAIIAATYAGQDMIRQGQKTFRG